MLNADGSKYKSIYKLCQKFAHDLWGGEKKDPVGYNMYVGFEGSFGSSYMCMELKRFVKPAWQSKTIVDGLEWRQIIRFTKAAAATLAING